MKKEISLESSYGLLLKYAKIANLKILIIFAKISYVVKMFAEKEKNDKISIFEKPLTMPFQICKIFCKIV